MGKSVERRAISTTFRFHCVEILFSQHVHGPEAAVTMLRRERQRSMYTLRYTLPVGIVQSACLQRSGSGLFPKAPVRAQVRCWVRHTEPLGDDFLSILLKERRPPWVRAVFFAEPHGDGRAPDVSGTRMVVDRNRRPYGTNSRLWLSTVSARFLVATALWAADRVRHGPRVAPAMRSSNTGGATSSGRNASSRRLSMTAWRSVGPVEVQDLGPWRKIYAILSRHDLRERDYQW
jgi:hypothetical protein